MKTNKQSIGKLFLEILPENISTADISALFPENKKNFLAQHNVKTAFVISSEPVDSRAYISLINTLRSQGLQVMNFYLDAADESRLGSIGSAVRDLHRSLTLGGCIVISYRSRFSLFFIACLHVYSGRNPDEAIAAVQNMKRDSAEIRQNAALLRAYHGYIMRPGPEASIVRDAIKINPQPSIAVPGSSPREDVQGGTGPAVASIPLPVGTGVEKAPVKKETAGKKEAAPAKGAVSKPQKDIITRETRIAAKKMKAVDIAAAQTGPFYRSIKFKLIAMISLLIIFSLTGMIFLASYYFKDDNKKRIQESNLQLSEVIALKIKSEIERYELISSVILKQGKAETMTGYENLIAAGEKEVIFSSVVRNPEAIERQKFDAVFYNKPLMSKLLITDKIVQTVNAANAKNFALSFAGEYLITNISQYVNNPVFALSFPYGKDDAGTVTSIIISYIKLENILKTFKTTGITRVFMVNYKCDVIVHPEINQVLTGANFSKLPICSMMMKSKIDNGQTRYPDEKGVYNLGSFKKIDVGGFGIIAAAEEDKAFQAVYDIQWRNMLITAIVATAAMMFVFFFGKTITTPIIRLVGATKKIIDGDYHMDIVPTTRDEVGQLTSTFIEMGKGLEEREKIKSTFGKFVNKEIAEAALRDELRLGGERKTVCILFSDIRSFTAISEKLEPEEVVEFLNLYMTRMVSCVEKTFGNVDKFIGDAIMAVWGTPLSHGNDTENSINSALLMRNELIEFNKERGGLKKPMIHIGCGINTGTVLAGQIGSENRMEYTVIGDPVNLASRIESLNKPFGTDVLVSQDSYTLVKDIFAVEKMKKIKVKGKIEPQQIYAVLGRLDDPARPTSLAELQKRIGAEPKAEMSDDEMDQLLDHGEEKYEIVEK